MTKLCFWRSIPLTFSWESSRLAVTALRWRWSDRLDVIHCGFNTSKEQKTLKRQSQEWTLISNSLWKSAEWPLESWRTSAEDNDSIQSAEKTLGMPQIHNIMSSEPITHARVRALHFLTATYRNRSLRKVQKDASSTFMSFKIKLKIKKLFFIDLVSCSIFGWTIRKKKKLLKRNTNIKKL